MTEGEENLYPGGWNLRYSEGKEYSVILKKMCLFILILLLFTASGFAEERFLEIRARKFSYTPHIIRVNKGDLVKVRLVSEDVTHGFFLDPPPTLDDYVEHPLLRSGLAFVNANLNLGKHDESSDDGIFTAMEALGLNLRGTDLVVLSACESGVGDVDTGEGVYGLQRAFLEAGAKAVLYSLWEVDDEATVHFMKRFYQHFIDGQQPQDALRRAQLEMLQHEVWHNPYFWGGFVLSGRA